MMTEDVIPQVTKYCGTSLNGMTLRLGAIVHIVLVTPL